MSRKAFLPFLTLAMIAGLSATPAFSQNRFMDEAREKAQRREENEAVRKAENPEAPAQTAKASQAPIVPAAPVEAAPAEATPAASAAAPATAAKPAQ